jgi:hypothetical protein
MRLFIPACGDRLTLASPWTFNLYLEHRNQAFAQIKEVWPEGRRWNVYDGGGHRLSRAPVTLPSGTVLCCDRVYIRTQNKSRVAAEDDYDSITWKVLGPNGKQLRGQRFWAKLHECNELEFDPGSLMTYRDLVKLPKLVMES